MLEKTEGTMQNVAGKVQGAVGAVFDDPRMQLNGKVREFAGKAQEVYGDSLNSVREAAVTSPIATLAMAAGIGFVIGALWARS